MLSRRSQFKYLQFFFGGPIRHLFNQIKIYWLYSRCYFYTFENRKRRPTVDSTSVKDLHHYVRQNQLIVHDTRNSTIRRRSQYECWKDPNMSAEKQEHMIGILDGIPQYVPLNNLQTRTKVFRNRAQSGVSILVNPLSFTKKINGCNHCIDTVLNNLNLDFFSFKCNCFLLLDWTKQYLLYWYSMNIY